MYVLISQFLPADLTSGQAPVSLASSLEEYLNDPNFEQNRIEYKTQKEAAERNAKLGIKPSPKPSGQCKSVHVIYDPYILIFPCRSFVTNTGRG